MKHHFNIFISHYADKFIGLLGYGIFKMSSFILVFFPKKSLKIKESEKDFRVKIDNELSGD
jgi:hypothetical protein